MESVAVVGSGKEAQWSLNLCTFWIRFLLRRIGDGIYFSDSGAAQSTKKELYTLHKFRLPSNRFAPRIRNEVSHCYYETNSIGVSFRFFEFRVSRRQGCILASGSMDQGLGTAGFTHREIERQEMGSNAGLLGSDCSSQHDSRWQISLG